MTVATVSGPRGLTQEEIERIHRAALRVLQEVGLQVANEAALTILRHAGAHIEGDRVHFPPPLVEEQLAANARARQGGAAPPAGRLTLGISDMCQHYLSPHSGAIEPMSTAHLAEACRAAESARPLGLLTNVPGIPADVPPPLQAIVTYRAGAEFLASGGNVHTLHPPEALPYLFAMAEAMGRPIRSAGLFPVSPLRLAGFEFDAIVEHAGRWQRLAVTTLPAVGATAPIAPRAAWVLSTAEAIGSAAVLHLVSGGKPVDMTICMYPFDLHTLTIVGGAPELTWMRWAGAQITRFYQPDADYAALLGTQAKRPGLQAGQEKALAGAFAVLTGCNHLDYAGVLSYDDIFSPEQMLADIELRDCLAHVAAGMPADDPEQWVEAIRAGVHRGYVQTDATLDQHHTVYWFPRLLDRVGWPAFQGGQGKSAEERLREEALARLESYAYRPPAHAIEDVRRIFAEAWHKLGGDPQAPCLPALTNG